jgi:hypothetical protein
MIEGEEIITHIEPQWQCYFCQKCFASQQGIRSHIYQYHILTEKNECTNKEDDDNDDSRQKGFPCLDCLKICHTADALYQHRLAKHTDLLLPTTASLDPITSSLAPTKVTGSSDTVVKMTVVSQEDDHSDDDHTEYHKYDEYDQQREDNHTKDEYDRTCQQSIITISELSPLLLSSESSSSLSASTNMNSNNNNSRHTYCPICLLEITLPSSSLSTTTTRLPAELVNNDIILTTHIQSLFTPIDYQYSFTCSICDKCFASQRSLDQHHRHCLLRSTYILS